MNLIASDCKTDFNQLELSEKLRVMFEAGYQSGFEDGLVKAGEITYDTTPFLTGKKPKKTSIKKVVIKYGSWTIFTFLLA